MANIVAAVGTAVHSDIPGVAQMLEDVMSKAVLDALADGVSINDSAELLRRKADALEQARAQWRGL